MMKKLYACGLSALVAIGFGAAEASAQIEVSGSVDFYYGYNFNKVDPSLRTFDLQHNTLSLGLAELVVQKAPTDMSRIGGRIDLDFGPTADLVAAFEPATGGTEVYKHVQQAYISVMASDNLTIDFGKFVTPHGAEVIESQGNWNYTRSILFGYAIPFYHTGVRAALVASEQLTLTGFIVNGWNNSSETNGDKTFAAAIALTPTDQLTWYATVMTGKDFGDGSAPADGEEDLVTLFDTTLSFVASDMLSLMANFDYGMWGDVKWWGLAGYARIQPQEDWALAGRVEYIDDSEGGFMTIGEKAQSFTVTSDHTVMEDLITRIEFRLDKTESDMFAKDDGTFSNTQPSVTVGLVYGLD